MNAGLAEGKRADLPGLSRGYRTGALCILAAAMTCGWADRTIIGTIGQAIKADLKLSDAELGLLHGFAFSITFVFMALPMARLAERRNRARIIAVCVAFWSLFTTLAGFSQNFVQLLLFRAGVGVGEAGGGPAAYSLISDYFPAERRASALSIYNLGVPLGTLIGAVLGGVVTQYYGWRAAFMFLGIPGLIVGLIVWIVVREVPRGLSDIVSGRAVEQSEPPSIPATAKRLFGFKAARHMLAALVIQTFVTHGAGAFNAPFFIRAFNMNYAEAGLVIGFAGGVASAIGTFSGGFLADHLAARRGKVWYAYVPMLSLGLACPLYILAYAQADWRLAVAFITVGWLVQYLFFSPMYAATYTLVEPRMRATTNAFMVLITNVIALLVGSMLTGALIDHFAAINFAFPGAAGFATACPGGAAPAGTSLGLVQACHSAIDGATRLGLSIGALGYGWAAVHFWFASRTIARDLGAFSGPVSAH